jgi:flagellar protein FlbD
MPQESHTTRRYVICSVDDPLTRLNPIPVVLNSDLIEHIEITPDTVIDMTTGAGTDEVIERIVEFRKRISESEGLRGPVAEPAAATPADSPD